MKEAEAREAEATAEVLARRGGNDGRVRTYGPTVAEGSFSAGVAVLLAAVEAATTADWRHRLGVAWT